MQERDNGAQTNKQIRYQLEYSLFNKMWKINSNEFYTIIEKRCNSCDALIDRYFEDHPLYKHLIIDLGLTDQSDLSSLEYGLEPYHFCSITKSPSCIDPSLLNPPSYDKKKKEEPSSSFLDRAERARRQDRIMRMRTTRVLGSNRYWVEDDDPDNDG